MHYIDFHTHLDWYTEADNLFLQLKDFKGTIVAASVDVESYNKNIEISDEAKTQKCSARIIPTLGVHPKNAAEFDFGDKRKLEIYKKLLPSSFLIGEIGMDFCWYKEADPFQQEKVFRFFLEHCDETEKYCVIHTKDAEARIARILEDYPKAKPVIHWYDGPEDVYQEFCHRGYMQTFGCETIRSPHLQKLLAQTPSQLILAETDNPTAEPWLGGTDNSVNLIKRVYKDIADLRNISVEELDLIIYENFMRICASYPV